jgi:hypothetical protein
MNKKEAITRPLHIPKCVNPFLPQPISTAQGDFSPDQVHRENSTSTTVGLIGGKNRCRRNLSWAKIQRREVEKRETTIHPNVIPPSISPLLNPYTTDHAYLLLVYLSVGQ